MLTGIKDYSHANNEIQKRKDFFVFSSNIHELYSPVMYDFGPVEFSVVVKFCKYVKAKVEHPKMNGRKLLYYVLPQTSSIINSLFLLAAYMILVMGKSKKSSQ